MLPPVRPRVSAIVAVALALLFGFTALLAQAYRAAREERAGTHYNRGRQLEAQGRHRAAVDEYRAALSFTHNDPGYRLALALVLMELGNWNEARTHLTQLRTDDPSSGIVNLMLARIEAREGRRDEAVADYHRAIYGYWPEDPQGRRLQARFELTALYARYGEHKQALAQVLELAAEAPEDAAVKSRIGRLLLEHGSPDQASEVFREAARLDPKSAEPWVGLGRARMAEGDWRGAAAAFRAALRRQEGNAQATRLLVVAEQVTDLDPGGARLSARERYRRARDVLARALAALERCHTLAAGAAAAEDAEAARKLLARRPGRAPGDVPPLLELAERLWNARQSACAAVPETDQALAAVMVRMAQ